ncbi:DUF2993 domain-containing protein [Streptomyces sp. NPDC051569]|uniref:DUF2993 domain-containing protein n=1 Tax=Streptomyces sp. NPDC051569 TaxID=3365661 RepID=UPI0037BCBBF5
MRTPTRIPGQAPNPYDQLGELAQLPPSETDFAHGAHRADIAGHADDEHDDEHDHEHEDDWSPPDHRRRRRFRGSSRFAKLTVALGLCGAFLLLADRAAEMYARDKAEEQLQRSLGLATRPAVDIHGFPFLTQVLGKRLDQVDVTVPDVAADRISLAEVRASGKDIRIVGDLPTAVRGAVIGEMGGDVLLSFDDLNRELGASQVKFTDGGADSVRVAGSLPVAGHDVQIRARAHIRREGGRAVSTTVDGIRIDIPGVATYRPGEDRAHSGLRLAPEAAARIAGETDRAKALLEIPAVVDRLGVPEERVRQALRDEDELHRLTGSPRFAQRLTGVNLADVVVDHPGLLAKAGVDPSLIDALLKLRPPELSDRLSLSFTLPDTPGDLRLRNITVEREGIRAELAGTGLRFGGR